MRILLFALIAVTLHACGGNVQKAEKAGRAETVAAVQPPESENSARFPKTDDVGLASRTARVSPPAPPSFSSEERDPSRLLDLRRDGLSAILGEPTFVRRDMSAEVWQYRTEACVLDLFLYRLDQDLAVTYYEFRARRNAALARDECFVSLLRQGISRAAAKT